MLKNLRETSSWVCMLDMSSSQLRMLIISLFFHADLHESEFVLFIGVVITSRYVFLWHEYSNKRRSPL